MRLRRATGRPETTGQPLKTSNIYAESLAKRSRLKTVKSARLLHRSAPYLTIKACCSNRRRLQSVTQRIVRAFQTPFVTSPDWPWRAHVTQGQPGLRHKQKMKQTWSHGRQRCPPMSQNQLSEGPHTSLLSDRLK